MNVWLKTPLEEFYQDLADVVRLFYGDVTVRLDEGEEVIWHTVEETDGLWKDVISFRGETLSEETPAAKGTAVEVKRLRKRAVKLCLYKLLKTVTGVRPPWGSLTGIRPTRLYYEGRMEGLSHEETLSRLENVFDVTPDKVSLIEDIVDMQKGVRETPKDKFDLYIGIPFCKTRCAYCSFAAGEIGNGKLVRPYVDALLTEIRLTAEYMRETGMTLRAGYVGGGTPTAIPREELQRVLSEAMRLFPGAVEWTVEAGRPDSIDRDMLKMILGSGATRISVNPQTFNDKTLAAVGRAHSAQEAEDKFLLAREMGFQDINMDLIAALPGESLEDFERTLERVIALAPESVTVHSLAIKRSSRLHERMHVDNGGHETVPADVAESMITLARRRLHEEGWHPYYLYRQKYMAGNLENVGYARPGMACLYNIGNMEETASVLALGAGGITKWLFDRELRIERAPNVKNIEQYIARVSEMVERKKVLIPRKGETP